MFVYRLAAAALAAAMMACAPSPGDCPTPDDCACPCTNEPAIVCDQAGTPYLNQCMLECNGGELGACDGDVNPEWLPQGSSADCDEQCGGDGFAPVCGVAGSGADRQYVTFDNACFRDCLGAAQAPDKKCE